MTKWYYALSGQQIGPLESAALKRLAISGRLKPDEKVWCEGMAEWQDASSVKGLFDADSRQQAPVSVISSGASTPNIRGQTALHRRQTPNTTKLFRILLVICIAVFVLNMGFGAAGTTAGSLPAELVAWQDERWEQFVDGNSTFLVVLLLALAVETAFIVSLVALLFLQRWGMWCLVASTVMGYVLVLAHGEPQIFSVPEFIICDVNSIALGAVIAIALCTDVLKRKNRPINP